MTNSVRAYQKIGELKTVITSVVRTGAKSPEDALDILRRLDRLGIEPFVTEEGDLLIRYWGIAGEDFVSAEHAAVVRSKRPFPEQTDNLDWLSKNLTDIRRQYGGQWVAIYGNEVVAADPNLPDLMNRVTEFDKPLVTFIPAEPVLWNLTYAHQKL
jgi:hypothetical protein